MIGTLDEAWNWFQASQEISHVMGRLGGKYWVDLPWDGPPGRDDTLRDLI
jgi:hypothetical protein